MKIRILASLLAIAIAAPASASPGSLRDFQLPSPQPTSTPQVQGPVDDAGVVPTGPRVIATPVPQPAPTSTPTLAPAASPASEPTAGPQDRPVVQELPENYRERQGSVAVRPQTAPPTSRPAQGSLDVAGVPAPTISANESDPSVDNGSALGGTTSEITPPNSAASDISVLPASGDEGTDSLFGNLTWWLAAFAAILALLVLFFALWKRRSVAAAYAPQIEAPLARTVPDTPIAPVQKPVTPAPPVKTKSAGQSGVRVPVQVKAEAISLSRSMMNATLQYRLSLRNLGTQPIKDAVVKVDVVTAHGKAPVNDQLANRETDLPRADLIADLAARDTHVTEAEFRLPVGQIRTIPQGKARLYVPLLRVRIEAPGKDPLTRTFVIGMLPPEGQSKLQPFRLDEMAQTYRQIGLRALD